MATEKGHKVEKGKIKGRENLMAKALSERAAAPLKQVAGTTKGKRTHTQRNRCRIPPISEKGFSVDMPAISKMISP
ncbi:hypothetical protein DJ030_16300 [bacterium endosymbiont of Escarpia laminata]|nr:MAG: hypothetical protein DJ030_16300 [bacterium endosymbiont of Escarpia laminata]